MPTIDQRQTLINPNLYGRQHLDAPTVGAIDFALSQDVENSVGLEWAYSAGFWADGVPLAADSLILTDDAENFIEANPTTHAARAVPGDYTGGDWLPIAKITTAGGEIAYPVVVAGWKLRAGAQGPAGSNTINVREADGTPVVTDVDTLIVSSGSLVDNEDGSVSLVVTRTLDFGFRYPATDDFQTLWRVPWDCTYTAWRIGADVAGDAVVDIWVCPYVDAPPDASDSIAGSEKPTLTDAQTAELTLAVPVDLNTGDVVIFSVESIASITRLDGQLSVVLR